MAEKILKGDISSPKFAKDLSKKVEAAEKKHMEICEKTLVTRTATPEELEALNAKRKPEVFPGSTVVGIPPRPLPQKTKGHRYPAETVREVQKAVILDGLSQIEAAERYGVNKNTVCVWIKNARIKQAEFGVVQEEPKTEPLESCVAEKEIEPIVSDEPAAIEIAEPPIVREESFNQSLKDGVEGLCLFLDLFGDTPLLDVHESKLIPELISRAEAFAQGVEYGRSRK